MAQLDKVQKHFMQILGFKNSSGHFLLQFMAKSVQENGACSSPGNSHTFILTNSTAFPAFPSLPVHSFHPRPNQKHGLALQKAPHWIGKIFIGGGVLLQPVSAFFPSISDPIRKIPPIIQQNKKKFNAFSLSLIPWANRASCCCSWFEKNAIKLFSPSLLLSIGQWKMWMELKMNWIGQIFAHLFNHQWARKRGENGQKFIFKFLCFLFIKIQKFFAKFYVQIWHQISQIFKRTKVQNLMALLPNQSDWLPPTLGRLCRANFWPKFLAGIAGTWPFSILPKMAFTPLPFSHFWAKPTFRHRFSVLANGGRKGGTPQKPSKFFPPKANKKHFVARLLLQAHPFFSRQCQTQALGCQLFIPLAPNASTKSHGQALGTAGGQKAKWGGKEVLFRTAAGVLDVPNKHLLPSNCAAPVCAHIAKHFAALSPSTRSVLPWKISS